VAKKFIWVYVDRDRTPDVPKKYGVMAYPSLLVLGKDDENVHRWAGFLKPKEYLAQLEEGLARHALYKDGKEWDAPKARPAKICDEGDVSTSTAPSDDLAGGLAPLGDALWVAQGPKLFRLDAKGAVAKTVELKGITTGLCTDGKLLYAIDYGWTSGEPIRVVDPATGEVTREIVTEGNTKDRGMSAYGIVWKNGKLHALSGGRGGIIFEVDPADGKILSTIKTGVEWALGLGYDGAHFIIGSREHLTLLDAEKGSLVRRVPLNYGVRSIAFSGGAYLLMEQPVMGNDRRHQFQRILPKEMLIHRLALPDLDVKAAIDDLASADGAKIQAAADKLVGMTGRVVPAIIARMDDRRPVKKGIGFKNKAPDALEGVRHYGPKQVVDALAAILNARTGQVFKSIYNGGSDADRDAEVEAWKKWVEKR